MPWCCSHLYPCRTGIEFPLANKHTLLPFMSVNNPSGYCNGMTQTLWVGRNIFCTWILKKQKTSYIWSDKVRILADYSPHVADAFSVLNAILNAEHISEHLSMKKTAIICPSRQLFEIFHLLYFSCLNQTIHWNYVAAVLKQPHICLVFVLS